MGGPGAPAQSYKKLPILFLHPRISFALTCELLANMKKKKRCFQTPLSLPSSYWQYMTSTSVLKLLLKITWDSFNNILLSLSGICCYSESKALCFFLWKINQKALMGFQWKCGPSKVKKAKTNICHVPDLCSCLFCFSQ